MTLLNTGLNKDDEYVYITIHVADQQLPISEEFEMQDTRPLLIAGYADGEVLPLVHHALIETDNRSITTTSVYKVLAEIVR